MSYGSPDNATANASTFPGYGSGPVTYLTPAAPPAYLFDQDGTILSSTNPNLIPATPSYTGNPGYYGGNNGQGNNFNGASASTTIGAMNPTQSTP